MGTNMEPGKQKGDSLSDTVATCDTAVALQLYLLENTSYILPVF